MEDIRKILLLVVTVTKLGIIGKCNICNLFNGLTVNSTRLLWTKSKQFLLELRDIARSAAPRDSEVQVKCFIIVFAAVHCCIIMTTCDDQVLSNIQVWLGF